MGNSADDTVGAPGSADQRDRAHDPGVDAGPVAASPATIATDRRVDTARVIPSRTDVVVGEASRLVGGPLGEHAVLGRSRHWTPLRVLFLLALCTLALSWFGKAGCLQQAPAAPTATSASGLRLDWDNQRQFTDLCYSDVIALYGAEKLDQGKLPYQVSWQEKDAGGTMITRYMEYPVITGMYMYGAAWLAHQWSQAHDEWGLPGALPMVLFFDLAALGLALFWLLTIWATALTAGARRWSTWLVAVSPLVIVHVFTNFDAIAIAMVSLAMLAWARRRPWLAGVFIGLGVAAKLYPILLLVALFLLCLRSGRIRAFAATACGAVLAWLAVNLPVLIEYPRGWSEFFRYNADRGADADSLLHLIGGPDGLHWDVDVLNAVAVILMVVVVAAVAFVALRAPTRPRLAQIAFLLVAGFLLVNKVWSPQYSLWLVPLAVLAIPQTRLLLAWMAVDALVWIPRMTLFLDPERHWVPEGWFVLAVAVRGLMVIAVCAVIVWQIWHPEDDLVRRDLMRGGTGGGSGPVDDPAGGVLDGAPDSGGAVRLRGRHHAAREPQPIDA